MAISEEPPYTCPMIDEVLTFLDEFEADQDPLTKRDIVGDMEDIRSNAENLRYWGEAWQEQAMEYEAKIEELEQELERIKEERQQLTMVL